MMKVAGGFFERLSVEHQQTIRSRATLRHVERGSKLFLQGDSPTGAYFVVQGHLKLTVSGNDGREALVEVCGPGDLIGAASVFDDHARPTSAFALTGPTEVLALDRAVMQQLARTDASFNAAILEELSLKLRAATARHLELAVDDVSGRVIRRLHELVSRFGVVSEDGHAVLRSPVTQQDMAAWAGVSRQAVVKELRRLRDEGLIVTSGSRFTIGDVGELNARVERLG